MTRIRCIPPYATIFTCKLLVRRCADESYVTRRMDGFKESAFEIEFLTYMNHIHKRLNYPCIKSKLTEGGAISQY